MAEKTKISEWIKWPAYLLGAITALAILLGSFGFGFSTPGEKWTEHDVQHVTEIEVQTQQFDKIDVALENIDDMQMEQQTLIESIVTGECIENPRENLERQRLIAKCRELGIER